MSLFKCSQCNYSSPKWLSNCPKCCEWNTFKEAGSAKITEEEKKALVPRTPSVLLDSKSKGSGLARLKTGIEELDRVFGGGIVQDSLVLLGGEPGVGKSTLILELIRGVIRQWPTPILYATGEESLEQVQDRAQRLKVKGGSHVYLLSETMLANIFEDALERRSKLLILDSIQTMRADEEEPPNTPIQLNAVTASLMQFAKKNKVACILIGHVTKDGDLAGPKAVEHLVDAVFSFEHGMKPEIRVLRASKNRFGSTMEYGLFEMHAEGLREVSDREPS